MHDRFSRWGGLVTVAVVAWCPASAALAQVCIPPPPGMIAWWPGDGSADDIVGARNGTLLGSVDYAPGKVGSAFRFSGGWVEVADDPIWTLGTEDFTVDLWVQFTSLSGRDPFVSHDEAGGCTNKWIFWYDESGHRDPYGPSMRFHAVEGADCHLHVDPVVYHPWHPNTGQWYHVAVTRTGSTYALYLDGALVSSEQDSNALPDPSIPLMLGRAEGYYLHGLLDEVEIFDRALSAGEIHAIHAAGSAGKCRYTTVAIDIKPGSYPNSLNPRSNGVVPVAILTTDTFDAASVDAGLVRFGLNGTEAEAQHSALEDVDADGDEDLILHFPTQSTQIACGATSALLTGQTTGAQPIQGVDTVKTVGCR